MSNGDDDDQTRKVRVHRVYKDDDPDENSDVWIDIERMDELRLVAHKSFPWQEKLYQFDWDSFPGDNVDDLVKKKIKDPNDDDNLIEVWALGSLNVSEGSGHAYQAYRYQFVDEDSTRETHSRRVYHYDISDNNLDDNKNPPKNSQDYRKSLGAKDKDQYVEVEIIDRYWTVEVESRDSHGKIKRSASQEKQWNLDNANDPLIKDRDGDTTEDNKVRNPGDNTTDPPWRLDPLQNIVNVSWSGGLAVEFGDRAEDAPPRKKALTIL